MGDSCCRPHHNIQREAAARPDMQALLRTRISRTPFTASRRSAVRVIAMAAPTIHYFPLRGRAEAMRLALKLAGVEFQEALVDRAEMKGNQSLYPFGQCPRCMQCQAAAAGQRDGLLPHGVPAPAGTPDGTRAQQAF